MNRDPQFPIASSAQLWSSDQYALLDFGEGRKLERFGVRTLDRPCPAALAEGRTAIDAWQTPDARLDVEGKLLSGQAPASDWRCSFEAPQFAQAIQFELRLTPYGHVGLFPEQADNWLWLAKVVQEFQMKLTTTPPRALNLFAYTGGSSLAMAAAGAAVVHVDASSPAVKWARNNAASSGGAQWPIRWIVEDARKFVARELRRKNSYQLIVLDPPSYGHGVAGQRWTLSQHLPELLNDCLQLLDPHHGCLLLTAHCENPTEVEIAQWLKQQLTNACVDHDRLEIVSQSGKWLDAGFRVRLVLGDSAHLIT